jgi:hypothetical protein
MTPAKAFSLSVQRGATNVLEAFLYEKLLIAARANPQEK